eukprot:TRINITY_DN11492_c6_g1_i2.p1 TRINITY_DN11492_c6_g1~~TRINITY_DN11492_c6_g1_i2.p1  ORF type:complete len:187 (+),score=12.44 TRINITY_DN11492_c6_g1_i2:247-807(+)
MIEIVRSADAVKLAPAFAILVTQASTVASLTTKPSPSSLGSVWPIITCGARKSSKRMQPTTCLPLSTTAVMTFFHNWLTDGFIVRATSSTPIGPFTYAAPVLEQVAGRWDANIMNPKLVRAIDGTYLLFYTGDANDQGQSRSVSRSALSRCILPRRFILATHGCVSFTACIIDDLHIFELFLYPSH